MSLNRFLSKYIVRNDTAANWATYNPVLDDGELAYDKTNARFKIGDGVSTWSALDFIDADHEARIAALEGP